MGCNGSGSVQTNVWFLYINAIIICNLRNYIIKAKLQVTYFDQSNTVE